jgi:acetate---CoA ligase (ADP-forming)
MPHKLDSLLCPQSIAIIGASQREDAVGNMVLKNILEGAYPGNLYAVNPGHAEIEGIVCYPSLSELPETVEHVVFAVSDERIEEALDSAIAHGIKAGTIFSSLILSKDTSPKLKDRIHQKAKQADLLLCGANSMGFYNFGAGIWACAFDTRHHRKQGNVTLISQSGSGMSGILDVDERIDFNFAVSTGQELIITAEDYLDYALEQKETRVIGFFMETSRHPDKLIAAFVKAKQRRIPIVVVKVGRTAMSSQLAESHSGAMAGSDRVYDAIFDYYGVQRVDDMDELATALIMFAQPHPVQAGGLVCLHDSGGERQLIIDLADKLDVALSDLSEETTTKLESMLDPGLPAVNPLDAWSVGGPDYHQDMTDCFTVLLKDDNAAFGAVVHDRAPAGHIYSDYIGYLRDSHKATGKAVFLVSNRQGISEDEQVLSTTREGFPVLDGIRPFLKGALFLMAYRDFLDQPAMNLPGLSKDLIARWHKKFVQERENHEHLASKFLGAFGFPVVKSDLVSNQDDLLISAATIGFPLVLKTAQPGIKHKSDLNGVVMDIQNEGELLVAYSDLSSRLGESVIIASMVSEPGVEMILGVARDLQFGPMIILGIGGIYTEALDDVIVLAPPFDAQYALRCLNKLNMRKILDAGRGRAALDIDSYCEAAALLSVLALEFEDQINEIDVNPVLLMQQDCLGLDALLVLNSELSQKALETRQASASCV